jgi:hypothetical protein
VISLVSISPQFAHSRYCVPPLVQVTCEPSASVHSPQAWSGFATVCFSVLPQAAQVLVFSPASAQVASFVTVQAPKE